MKYFLRFTSKLFDYSWFAIILYLILDHFDCDVFFFLIAIISLPFLFIPIETIQIKLLRTTIGKILFGFKYSKLLTWKQSIEISIKNAILIAPLFIPIINILFIYIYIRKINSYRSYKSVFPNVIQKRPCLIKYCISLILIAFPYVIYFNSDNAEITENINKERTNEWVKVTSNEAELDFFILFPKKPQTQEILYNVPRTNHKLNYKEYFHQDTLYYSLGYFHIPAKWSKIGSSIIFKVATKFLNNKGKVINKKKSTHKNYPSLEYHIKNKKNQIIIGKLILKGNILYKIETRKNLDYHEEKDIILTKEFLNSFSPSAGK